MSSQKEKSQDPISVEDLQKFLDYVITKQVHDEKHAKELRRLARRTTTLSDVIVLYEGVSNTMQSMITQIMEAVRVQQGVLERLGATPEMFEESRIEYQKQLEEVYKQINSGSDTDTKEEQKEADKESGEDNIEEK